MAVPLPFRPGPSGQRRPHVASFAPRRVAGMAPQQRQLRRRRKGLQHPFKEFFKPLIVVRSTRMGAVKQFAAQSQSEVLLKVVVVEVPNYITLLEMAGVKDQGFALTFRLVGSTVLRAAASSPLSASRRRRKRARSTPVLPAVRAVGVQVRRLRGARDFRHLDVLTPKARA